MKKSNRSTRRKPTAKGKHKLGGNIRVGGNRTSRGQSYRKGKR